MLGAFLTSQACVCEVPAGQHAKMSLLERIEHNRIIPVLTVGREVELLADALFDGGLTCIELALGENSDLDSVRRLANRRELVVGASWVLSIDQAAVAIEAGVDYVACPGFNNKVIQFCQRREVPVLPGVSSPTEIQMAYDLGVTTVMFFPAEATGGIAMLSAVGAPYPEMRFIPVGGITPANLMGYLHQTQVIACGANWMTEPALYSAGDYARVTAAARAVVSQTVVWKTCPKNAGPLSIQYRAKGAHSAMPVNGLS